MPIFSHTPGEPTTVMVNGYKFLKSDWLDSGNDPILSPTVFLVEQAPNASLRTHFHKQNQFQLFVRGSGSIGPHRLEALTVHYAGAFSGYGPILSGPKGLDYFTLRSVFEEGSRTIKQHEAEMKRGPKRQLHSTPLALATNAELTQLERSSALDLIELQHDHIAAQLFTLAPGDSATGRNPVASAGQFYVVLGGSILAGGRTLQKWQSVFIASDEGPLRVQAGAGGAQAVCLQLPHKIREYH